MNAKTTKIHARIVADPDGVLGDIFDRDELARLTAEVSGVPTPVLRSPDTIKKIRDDRAAQEQQMMEMQAAQPLAAAMKDAAQAQNLLRGAA